MHYTSSPATRDDYIAGLHALASYLTSNPAVPVPTYGTDIEISADSDQGGGFAQVDHIARLLKAPVINETARGGHYLARRKFGPVSYTIRSIPETYMAQHRALMSYHDSVIP